MKKKPTIDQNGRATFVFVGRAKEVFLCGDFNDWRKIPLFNRKGRWFLTTPPIPEGTYGFRYIIDGIPQPIGTFDVGSGDYPVVQWTGERIEHRQAPRAALTIVSFNTQSLQTTTRRFAKLNKMVSGLAFINADVICLNEVVSGKLFARGYDGIDIDTAEYIRSGLSHFSGREHFLISEPFAQWDSGENLGNAIISTFPITETSSTALKTTSFWPAPNSSRRCLGGRIRVPGKGNISVFVTHLMGFDYPDTPVQIEELKRFVAAQRRHDDWGTIVAGDFNIPSKSKSNYEKLTKTFPTFIDTYALANPKETNAMSAPDGKHRIDYIFWIDGLAQIGKMHVSSSMVFKGEPFQNKMLEIVSDHFAVVTTLS